MTIGPGKYDDLCTDVREKAQALAALVIIIGGKHGGGFSCQTEDPRALIALPAMLRSMADQIEADQRRGKF